MILILLVSAMQFNLYKMECLMSGDTTLSLSEFDSCDKTTPEKSSFSKKCCDFNDISFDFDYDSYLGFKTFKVNIPTTLPFKKSFALLNPSVKTTNFNNYTNLPPPGGTELLRLVQVFRI